MVQRGVRKHDAEGAVARCRAGLQPGIARWREHDGSSGGGERLLSTRIELDDIERALDSRSHDREWLAATLLSTSKFCDHGLVPGIADEVIATNALDRQDLP